MAFVAISLVSCGDDDEFSGPYLMLIDGPTSVVPTEVESYAILFEGYNNGDNASWTISGPGTIEGSATGEAITVSFQDEGEVTLNVSDGVNSGILVISVGSGDGEVTADLENEGVIGESVLSSGQSDTVYLYFRGAVTSAIDVALLEDTDSSYFNEDKLAFSSGSLGDLTKVNDKTFYAIYTAGDGNGTPEALITGLSGSAAYASDSAYFELFVVDNKAPEATFEYSDDHVADSTEVKITVTFSEPIMFANPSDTLYYISFNGGGVMSQTDTLMATDDELVYTFTYVTNGDSDGEIDIDLLNVVDYADNAPELINNTILADNTAPTLVFDDDLLTIDNIVVTENISEDGNAAIEFAGTDETVVVYYSVTDEELDTPSAEDIIGEGLISGSFEADEIYSTTHRFAFTEEAGEYYVYVVLMDKSGLYSSVESRLVTFN